MEQTVLVRHLQDTKCGPVDCLLQVGIGKLGNNKNGIVCLVTRSTDHNASSLTTQLKCNFLQVTFSCCFHDLAANDTRSSERHLGDNDVSGLDRVGCWYTYLPNIHVLRDGSTDGVSVAVDDIEHTRRKSSFSSEAGNKEGGD